MKNYKGIKIEIKPTGEQIEKINKTIGTGRFLYNFYIAYNKEIYEKEKRFITGFEFSKYINNIFIKNYPYFLIICYFNFFYWFIVIIHVYHYYPVIS